ncbi:sensor histidine kinase [Anaerotalea alkaliphila]|uniref:histidine kinase n=1 Tax=Anaerotalea alkaliphila TaxID=2662126 RepID=A0A7X5KMN3_9FIRM|nr:sensor histidine kinase [Anaerotalea alkaliphila]NDL67139.1 sensor histidine kinase [Anaerotalea alkaliphila]
MLLDLLGSLFNKLGVLVLVAFVLSRTRFMKDYLLKDKLERRDILLFSLIFGGLGIVGTYTGVQVDDAIANSRSIGVVVAGLFGGPWVGTLAGVLAGVHRMLLPEGRFTAIACGISTIIGGVIAGNAKRVIDRQTNRWLWGGLLTILIEAIQMGIILLIARPFESALHLVKLIFLPMSVINSAGTAAFILLIEQIHEENERAAAVKAQLALNIATKTLPILRNGLDKASAQETADIILASTGVSAVSITDRTHILAHAGVGSDHHRPDQPIHTEITRKAIETGQVFVAHNREGIECRNPGCRLQSAIVVPLLMRDQLIGTLKLYQSRANGISSSETELAKGLGHLFSTQLELSQLTHQRELLARTELKMLQAQIHPHFLFNALNTIIAFCRTDAPRARELLTKLSFYLRTGFKTTEEFVPFEQELQHVDSYLSIEEARFSDRLKVFYEIEDDIKCMVPPLLLQPIVENALKHGLSTLRMDGELRISAKKEGDEVLIRISDNGKGMSPEQVRRLLDPDGEAPKAAVAGNGGHTGIGLRNVQARLQGIYHTGLTIESEEGAGTNISFRLPLKGGYPWPSK